MSNELANTSAAPSATGLTPAHIQPVESTGMELLRQYVTPPRLKFVQPASKGDLKQHFNEGDLICTPQKILIRQVVLNENHRPTEDGTPFTFVPVFFYPEFLCWNPIQMQGQLPVIRDRSTDPKSDLARKCRNPNLQNAPCPEDVTYQTESRPQYQIRYVEHLNYLVMLQGDGPLWAVPTLMSFARAEYRRGTDFGGMLELRTGRQFPIWGCQFVAAGKKRSNNKGEWYGYNISNPSPPVSPWVEDAELYAFYGTIHEQMRAAHAEGLLQAEYDDDAPLEGSAQPVSATGGSSEY